MGILDALGLSAGAGDRRYASVGGAGRLVAGMRRGHSDAVLSVIGDSTGNETFEWAYRLTVWLGTQFPAYTVNYRLWNDGTQGFDTAVAIQVGTGSRTLTVYNGSVSGSDYSYFLTAARFAAMFAASPTAVIVSYGYNGTGASYRSAQSELADWVLSAHPHAEYIVTSQPPKATAHADAADHLSRQLATRSIAIERGWGVIDVTQRFIDYGTYGTLINVDNIHPLVAGQDIWFAEAARYFGSYAPAMIPGVQGRQLGRLFLDPSRFIAFVGTPELTFIATSGVPKWDFDPTTEECITCVADIPPEWGVAVTIDIVWSTPGGSTNSVVWRVDYSLLSATQLVQSGTVPIAATAGTPLTIASTSTANTIRYHRPLTATSLGTGRPVVFQVRRIAADAADTYASDAYFIGLIIRRAE